MQFPSLDPRLALRVGFYALLGVLLTLGVRALRAPGPAENPAYDALVVALNRRIVADSVSLADANEKLVRHEQVASRTITKYREIRDTFRITDTVAVKEFVQRADSAVRSCTELVESCATFRVRAESSLAGLTLDRDRWKLTAESLKPSGFDRFVRRTLPVVMFVAGAYVGSRVTR